jgi:hypothetical protein
MIRTLTEYSNHMEKRTEWQELEQLKFLTESRLLPRRIRGWVPEFTFQAESGKDAAHFVWIRAPGLRFQFHAQADRFPALGIPAAMHTCALQQGCQAFPRRHWQSIGCHRLPRGAESGFPKTEAPCESMSHFHNYFSSCIFCAKALTR